MKSLRPARSGFRPGVARARSRREGGPSRGDLPGDAGFSLIELMVVVTVICLLAAAAAVGWRRSEFKNQYARFVADVEGTVVLARNTAIDRQTQVRLDVTSTEAVVTAFDPATHTWERVHAATMDNPNAALIGAGATVCIFGFTPGVQPPAASVAVLPPTGCLVGPQQLVFEPDGRMTDPFNAFDAVPNAGATLWVADQTLSSTTKYAIIQIFPGGLVRTFEDLE
jgi:prepilin-type N-terminal cleavage/methylation domain-containing protein